MYKLTINNQSYIFTDNQQWLDNNTFCVIATCNGDEYCISYDVPTVPAGEENSIDWEMPSTIEWLSDGAIIYAAS